MLVVTSDSPTGAFLSWSPSLGIVSCHLLTLLPGPGLGTHQHQQCNHLRKRTTGLQNDAKPTHFKHRLDADLDAAAWKRFVTNKKRHAIGTSAHTFEHHFYTAMWMGFANSELHLKQGGLKKGNSWWAHPASWQRSKWAVFYVASPYKLIKATRSLHRAYAGSVSSLHAGDLVCEECLREIHAKPMRTAKVATRRTSQLRQSNSNEQGPKLRMTKGVMSKSCRFR